MLNLCGLRQREYDEADVMFSAKVQFKSTQAIAIHVAFTVLTKREKTSIGLCEIECS